MPAILALVRRDRSTTASPREVEVVVEVMAVATMEELEVAMARTTATAVLRASIGELRLLIN